jgi:hypothetical protein
VPESNGFPSENGESPFIQSAADHPAWALINLCGKKANHVDVDLDRLSWSALNVNILRGNFTG